MREHKEPTAQTHDELLKHIGMASAVLDSIGDAVSIQDLDFRIVYQNEAHRKLFGCHVGEYCYSALHRKAEVCTNCSVLRAIEEGVSHTMESECFCSRGVISTGVTASAIKNPRGGIIGGMKIVRDISARRGMEEELTRYRTELEHIVEERTEELRSLNQQLEQDISERIKIENAFRKSEAFVNNILESVGEGLIVIDPDYRIISANKAFLRHVGREAGRTIGHHCYEVSHGADTPCHMGHEYCPPKQTFETGEPHQTIHVHRDDSGNSSYVEIRSYPMKDEKGRTVSVIETISDITTQRKLEEQLRSAQKLEAVGQLAGGIAHDFNNILTGIIGYGNLLQMQIPEKSALRSKVDQIVGAAEKAANLTQGLLAYSRKQVINPRPVDLNQVIEKIGTLLSRLIGADVELRTDLTEDPAVVNADPGQIEQVLMNLVTNARDAMPDGGRLTIGTACTDITREFIAARSVGVPGKHIALSVTDSGIGMDRKTKAKIFDPFFTTKEVGKGTGLGLAMVYGIIKQHEGFTDVTSEIGKGTRFTIYLPAAKDPTVEQGVSPVAPFIRGGTETVLLAEDDAMIRRLTQDILERAGYEVLAVGDGSEAVREFILHRDSVDLLLLDVIMPKKNGKAVYDEIRKMKPSVRTLFFSGHTADLLQEEGKLAPELNFVSKPLSVNELLARVREILDRP
ncbi:MAG: PAS domain-containing protein [Nitrospiraceae bacterium]|nr:PAS domain-containing protein [Nitrospiraceae bacterium]